MITEMVNEILKNRIKEIENNSNAYFCKHCNKIVKRESSKQWIKSYCDETGKTVHLLKLNNKQYNLSCD
jgi:ribosomal protein L37AE/L43A